MTGLLLQSFGSTSLFAVAVAFPSYILIKVADVQLIREIWRAKLGIKGSTFLMLRKQASTFYYFYKCLAYYFYISNSYRPIFYLATVVNCIVFIHCGSESPQIFKIF
jgi:hypothetical protein